MNELDPCPACGAEPLTGYTPKGPFGIFGWTTECNSCDHGIQVTRFTKDRSRESWNLIVRHKNTLKEKT